MDLATCLLGDRLTFVERLITLGSLVREAGLTKTPPLLVSDRPAGHSVIRVRCNKRQLETNDGREYLWEDTYTISLRIHGSYLYLIQLFIA